jgi:hypothetical protein
MTHKTSELPSDAQSPAHPVSGASTRRSFLMNTIVAIPIADAAQVASPSIANQLPASAAGVTPVAAAIERYRSADALFYDLSQKLEDAKDAVLDKHGHRPIPLVAWRNYSHIGGSEIEDRRREFLLRGEDPKIIENEYRAVKQRERDIEKAGTAWDRRAGLTRLTKHLDLARVERHAAQESLASLKLLTVADAAAIVDLVCRNLEEFSEPTDWEKAALENARRALNKLAAVSQGA